MGIFLPPCSRAGRCSVVVQWGVLLLHRPGAEGSPPPLPSCSSMVIDINENFQFH